MNYIKITQFDTANGLGIGTVIWLTGCTHNCEGCHNPQTHNPHSGYLWTKESEKLLLDSLKPDYVSRLTFSGGDPLFSDNRLELLKLVKRIKQLYPQKKIWMYTGYNWEMVKDLPIIPYLDVLVDGRFILEQRDLTLLYRGSFNQRVIDVQKSLQSNCVCLLFE